MHAERHMQNQLWLRWLHGRAGQELGSPGQHARPTSATATDTVDGLIVTTSAVSMWVGAVGHVSVRADAWRYRSGRDSRRFCHLSV